jgi:hypothetical protein
MFTPFWRNFYSKSHLLQISNSNLVGLQLYSDIGNTDYNTFQQWPSTFKINPYLAIFSCLFTCTPYTLRSRMPWRRSSVGQQTHRNWGCIDYSHVVFLWMNEHDTVKLLRWSQYYLPKPKTYRVSMLTVVSRILENMRMPNHSTVKTETGKFCYKKFESTAS